MKKFLYVLIIISLFLFVGCGKNGDAYEYNSSPMEGASDASSNSGIVEEGAKIIYRCSYDIYATETANIISSVKAKLKEVGGYVSKSSSNYRYAEYVYRVPVLKFEAFLDFMDAQEGICKKALSSEDVTSNYNRYASEIESLLATKAAYESLLTREGLTVSEITNIYEKIQEVDAKLLYYNNTMAELENSIAYTYVTVRYYEEEVPVEKSEFVEFFEGYWDYLVALFKFVCKSFMYLLPFGVVGGIIAVSIIVPIRVRAKKNKEKEQ